MTGSFREAVGRLVAFFRKKQRDGDLDAELAVHIDLAVEENIRQGMPAGRLVDAH